MSVVIGAYVPAAGLEFAAAIQPAALALGATPLLAARTVARTLPVAAGSLPVASRPAADFPLVSVSGVQAVDLAATPLPAAVAAPNPVAASPYSAAAAGVPEVWQRFQR